MPSKVRYPQQTLEYVKKLQDELAENRGLLQLFDVDVEQLIHTLYCTAEQVRQGSLDSLLGLMWFQKLNLIFQSVEHCCVYGVPLFPDLRSAKTWENQRTIRRAQEEQKLLREINERQALAYQEQEAAEIRAQQLELAERLGISPTQLARLQSLQSLEME